MGKQRAKAGLRRQSRQFQAGARSKGHQQVQRRSNISKSMPLSSGRVGFCNLGGEFLLWAISITNVIRDCPARITR
jgi:hypothetical protein